MLEWLNGKKTYIGMILLGILGLLWSQGLIGDELAGAVGAILTAWTGVALRHGIKKAELNP
jgi:hypothetical protein